eukprot:3076014-Rhodomonas_salina.2
MGHFANKCTNGEQDSSHAFKASGEAKPAEAQQQPAAAAAAAAGRGHAAVGNQGGAGGVGLGAAGGAMPLPQYVPVPHRPQGRPPPVQQLGVVMMALTGEVESNSEEVLLSPFAFHSNLTEESTRTRATFTTS